MIRRTEARIKDQKEILRTSSIELKKTPDDEVYLWLKENAREMISRNEKFLKDCLIPERISLKDFLGY